MPDASVAVAAKVKGTIGDDPLLGETLISEGHVMAGGALSTTISGNEHVFTFPALSVVVHVTVVVVCTVNRVTPASGHTSDAMPDPSVADTLDAKFTKGSFRLSDACVVYE